MDVLVSYIEALDVADKVSLDLSLAQEADVYIMAFGCKDFDRLLPGRIHSQNED